MPKEIVFFFLFYFVIISPVFSFTTSDADTTILDSTHKKLAYIHFNVEPDSAFLYLNNDYENLIIIKDKKLLVVPKGLYRLQIFGDGISDKNILLYLDENETHAISLKKLKPGSRNLDNTLYAAYMWDANLMLFSDEDTEISILYTEHYSYGMLRETLPPGSYRVQFKCKSGRVKHEFIELKEQELTMKEYYFRPDRRKTLMAGIMPGASQLYKRQTGRAALIFGAFGISTGLALYLNQQVVSDGKQFNATLDRYRIETYPDKTLELGNRLDMLSGRINNNRKYRDVFIAASIVIYLANFIDTLREPETGFARNRPFNPFRDFSIDFENETVVAKFQIRF